MGVGVPRDGDSASEFLDRMARKAPMPAEFMTETQSAMVPLHEMYTGMVAAGFTQLQACTILGVWLANCRNDGENPA